MIRLIPGKTKVQIELFKGVSLADILIASISFLLIVFVLISSLPYKVYIIIGLLVFGVLLLARVDAQPNYLYLLHILRHFGLKRRFGRSISDAMLTWSPEEDSILSDEEEDSLVKRGKRELKQQKKAEKKLRKKEDKLLRSKKTPAETKDNIYRRRGELAKRHAEEKAAAKEAASSRKPMQQIVAFTGIKDSYIEYGGDYFGAVLEIPAVEFRFFSEHRRVNSIENGLGRVLRSISPNYSANIVKLERPIQYDDYLAREHEKLAALRRSFEQGFINEDELMARVEIMYDRIAEVEKLCYKEKVIEPFYYLVLYEKDKRQLENQLANAINTLQNGEMKPRRLQDKDLAVFLKYSNCLDFEERDIEKLAPENYAAWAMPETVTIKARSVEINKILTHNMRILNYPTAVGDAWLAGVFSMPGTKCVIKCRPMDRSKSTRIIDRSLQELRGQYMATGVDSKRIELQGHIESLGNLLAMLQQDNEALLEVNVYVTAYDAVATENSTRLPNPEKTELPRIPNMKKLLRRTYQESGMQMSNMEFDQAFGFIGAQISGRDPLPTQGRGIPSNSLAAAYPWIYASVSDVGGINLGKSDGVPVFIDFFRRDSERVNSNMVIVGKSGSGKSYATKSLLTNLAAEDSKIFVLDPENEYTDLADNLHGKFINVGNALQGRLNPFHIITALDDDEAEGASVSGSYSTHLQFLEEFFRQILPDCDKDAMEYLNSLVDRMYTNRGITTETDLSRLRPEDYPIFDDLYDSILMEFQQTDNEYIRSILRVLMNYIAKFSTGGRNANIWNGPSTVTTEENFIVFNFQSLLANRNSTIANAQMLLVLKYIDNEIIKNREYNRKYGLQRKVIVAIDEAHVFIDNKYPVALDFMFQLAKRIRKYNGMQIVITQNIKDFVGSEEIARKSTAIINACQYSFIFSLAPNDISDLCLLYEKAGGINEMEQEQITTAARGQAFTIMSPSSRSNFQVVVPPDVVAMFDETNFQSRYFLGNQGMEYWEDFVGDSRDLNQQNLLERRKLDQEKTQVTTERKQSITFLEIDEEEFLADQEEQIREAQRLQAEREREEARIRAEREREEARIRAEREREEARIREELAELAELAELEDQTELAEQLEEELLLDMSDELHIIPDERPKHSPAANSFALSQDVVPGKITLENVSEAAPAAPSGVSVSGGDAVQILAQLLERFSYQAMLDEIRRSVRSELDRELGANPQKFTAAAAPASVPVPAAEEPEESMDDDVKAVESLFGDLFGGSDDEEEALDSFDLPEYEEGGSYSGSSDDSDEDEDDDSALPFDIMALLSEQAERMKDISPIDMMEAYDETVIDISLDDLGQYIRKMLRG